MSDETVMVFERTFPICGAMSKRAQGIDKKLNRSQHSLDPIKVPGHPGKWVIMERRVRFNTTGWQTVQYFGKRWS